MWAIYKLADKGEWFPPGVLQSGGQVYVLGSHCLNLSPQH